jgi:hypothetical protein
MKPSEDEKLIEIVKATGEIYGRTVSLAAALMFLADLEAYEPASIRLALSRCRKELRTFPTVADVISRIEDGHPGVEEAWSMIPKDEDGSVVWSEQMAEAYGAARGLLDEGDAIAARMAFKEVYSRLVAEARHAARLPRWSPSFGHNPSGREAALSEAVSKKRLSAVEAHRMLPATSEQSPRSGASQLEPVKSPIQIGVKK